LWHAWTVAEVVRVTILISRLNYYLNKKKAKIKERGWYPRYTFRNFKQLKKYLAKAYRKRDIGSEFKINGVVINKVITNLPPEVRDYIMAQIDPFYDCGRRAATNNIENIKPKKVRFGMIIMIKN